MSRNHENKKSPRESFASSFGAIVAIAGSAIGLGNLWRFPYLVGTNGGSAFILIYLACIVLLSIPIMIAEFTIGRRSQANAFLAMKVLAPGSKWSLLGLLFVISSFLILSFYSVVGGWTVDYLVRALSFNLTRAADAAESFRLATSSTFRPMAFTSVFVAASAVILLLGVKGGIEKSTKLMMPLLFVLIIVLAIRSVCLNGAGAGVEFLLKPDFSKVNAHTVLAAMGQAFFSLSVGLGTILTYGSYVHKSEDMISMNSSAAIADTFFALLAGFAIMPAVFALGISPSEGPGLLFIALPEIFNQIDGGSVFAILFFLSLFLAAITSSISILEVIVAYLSEELGIGRKKAAVLSGLCCLVFALLCSLSQGPLNGFKIFGLELFSLFDSLTTNVLLPLGALLMVIFVAWRMKKSDFMDEISSSGTLSYNPRLYEIIYFIIKYISPCAIAVILVFGLLKL